MFPLYLLGLLFIAPRTDDKKARDEDRKGEREEERGRGPQKGEVFRRGDLLEVPGTLFTHFGIYLGGGRVAHLIPDILPVLSRDRYAIRQMVTNSRLLLGVLAKVASVRVDSVEDFANGSEILVNQTDKVCSRSALQGEEVAWRAEQLLGSVRYSLLWWNSEHYVMYCRYGAAVSFQTSQFCKTTRKYVLSRRSAYLTAVLGLSLLLYLGAVTLCSALGALLLPFTIWMAA